MATSDSCLDEEVLRHDDTPVEMSSSDVAVARTRRLASDDTDNVDDDTNTEINEVYMSLFMVDGKLGGAFYRTDTMEVSMIPDTAETSDFSMLKRMLKHILPSTVIVSTKLDEHFNKCLKQTAESLGPDKRVTIEILPSIDFSEEMSKRRLFTLNMPSMSAEMTETARMLRISSLVPFENHNMIRAVGALLKFLERNRVGVQLEDAGTRVPILAVRVFIFALQIFKADFHPSGAKANSKREGFSVFETLNQCKSNFGSNMLKSWLQHPLRDVRALSQRLDAVAYFANMKNIEVTTLLQTSLRQIKPIGTVHNALQISEMSAHVVQSNEIAIFRKICDAADNSLGWIVQAISRIVDLEDSTMRNRFIVKPNVDAELDERKRIYNGLPDYLTGIARAELDQLERLNCGFTECNVMYLPQVGYMLAFKLPESMKQAGNYAVPTLDFIASGYDLIDLLKYYNHFVFIGLVEFLNNTVAHYKSERMRELDEHLGDLHCDIMDRETALMHRLQTAILERSESLINVVQCIAELDCLISLATAARMNNYCRPELTNDHVLHVIKGRHPLQELCCCPYVVNDTHNGGTDSKIKLLTGANASGKSVYLKQVALIVFMAHIGSFVSADEARIGMIDQVFTRVHNTESVSVLQSSFMIDLNQVSDAANCATGSSLVILDEFGKGTESTDGMSLLCACIKFWLARGADCPHVFVSTHLHGITRPEILPPNPLLSLQTMAVMEEQGELVYLYHLIDGSTDISYAINIATRAGLSADLLTRASEVYDLMRSGLPVTGIDKPSARDDLKRCESIVSRFMAQDVDSENVKDFLYSLVVSMPQAEE